MSDSFIIAFIGLILSSTAVGFIVSSIALSFLCIGLGLIVLAFVTLLVQER